MLNHLNWSSLVVCAIVHMYFLKRPFEILYDLKRVVLIDNFITIAKHEYRWNTGLYRIFLVEFDIEWIIALFCLWVCEHFFEILLD